MIERGYMTAQEAAEELGITTATLYSYVSRGLIRSEEGGGKTRARRYSVADVVALKERKAQRRNPERAAAGALDFGSPVLESSITLIEAGQLYYRGQNVVELVKRHTFEEVAALIWTGAVDSAELFSPAQRALLPEDAWRQVLADLPPLDTFQHLLLSTAERDLASYNTEPYAVAQTGVRLLRLLAWSIDKQESASPLSVQLQQLWVPHMPEAARLLDAALILCADHGLNISAFTARCVASAGTSPYLAVNAALCALRGYRHGGQTQWVAELFDDAAADPAYAVAERLKQGRPLPGFGHPLYPQGDPRGRCLVDMVKTFEGDAVALAVGDRLRELAEQSMAVTPNIDFALVFLARALNLPANAPLLLFTAGRMAGWIGQINEELQRKQLIRPRARYVGPHPKQNSLPVQ